MPTNNAIRLSPTQSRAFDARQEPAVLKTHVPRVFFDQRDMNGIPRDNVIQGVFLVLLCRYLASADVLIRTAFGRAPRVKILSAHFDSEQSFGAFLEGINRQIDQVATSEVPAPSVSGNDAAEAGIWILEGVGETGGANSSSGLTGLRLQLVVRTDAGSLEWRYDPAMFPSYTVSALARSLARLLEMAPTSWDIPLGDLRLLTGTEERQLLVDWNQTRKVFDPDACIHTLFERQAARSPEVTAIVFRERQWTYRELDAKAEALAGRLRLAGVRVGSLVAVALYRSPELIAAILAVLKAGGAYVPLDPTYPGPRLGSMLEDARPAAVIVSNRTIGIIPQTACAVLHIEEAAAQPIPSGIAPTVVPGTSPAYVIYTSGSTGRPKGVVVAHRNAANFFTAMDDVIGNEPGVWLAVSSFSFDISVFELLWTLTRGFKVVVQEESSLTAPADPAYSPARQMQRHRVTHLQCTPSLASMLIRDGASFDALRMLRCLIVGGEALTKDLAQKLSSSIPGAVFNMYGPTETTIWSAVARVRTGDERVSIGRPIANTQLYVLDGSRRAVPAGFPGELYIGGAGVASGYLGRPELTAERFVPNPFDEGGGPIYRTGDIVRYGPNGALEFIGRADQQVKIRGFRIEPGEIENVLRGHPGVRDAAVVVRAGPAGTSDKRLLAYVIPENAGEAVSGEIRNWLRQLLPEPMVPGSVTLLERFPQTPNGKLDRNALPEPEEKSEPVGESPRSAMEQDLAAIWADVLGVDAVSLTRGFFDLGGHSLLMVEVHDRLQDQLGVQLSLVDLFRYPTVRELAGFLEKRGRAEPVMPGTDRGRTRQQAAMMRARLNRSDSAGSP